MRAVMCKALGMPDTLVFEEVADPTPAAGEVIIDMRSAGVNFPDVLMVQGLYQFKPELPFSPGGELSGVISAVGEGVEHLKVGDRVMALVSAGAFAEKCRSPANRCVKIPDGVDFDTAAAFTLTYGTSWHALKDRAALKEGQTVFVMGAAGGVGLSAIQIAKALGARVIAAASTDEKLQICRDNGADECINYSNEDMRARLKELTNGKGPDVVYDPVGGQFAEAAFRSIGWRGRYLVIGFANGEIPKLPLNLPLLKGAEVVGVFWGDYVAREPANFANDLKDMFALIAKGTLRPHVSARFALPDGAAAITHLMNRQATGKVVVYNDAD